MYQTPTLATLDATATAASCCRVIVSTREQSAELVTPLCPFPAPTPDVCVISTGSPLTPDAVVCVLAN